MVNENYVSLKEEKFKILQNTPLGSDEKDSEKEGLQSVSDVSPNWKERHDKPIFNKNKNKNKNTKESYYQVFNKKPPHK